MIGTRVGVPDAERVGVGVFVELGVAGVAGGAGGVGCAPSEGRMTGAVCRAPGAADGSGDEPGGVGCDDSAERAGALTGGRGGKADGRTGDCPAAPGVLVAPGVMPLGRCGGMNGRGAPVGGLFVPCPNGCDAALAGVLGVGFVDDDGAPPAAAGVADGACVGAVMRVDGVSVRVGRGGVVGAGVGVAASDGALGVGGVVSIGVDEPASLAPDEIDSGCVVTVP